MYAIRSYYAVAETAKANGYKDIYRQSLIPMTEMQKLMGKTKFEKILGDLIYKPLGKPTLVPSSDKRPAMNVSNAKNEFNEILEENPLLVKADSHFSLKNKED